jgi:hypothetical protein
MTWEEAIELVESWVGCTDSEFSTSSESSEKLWKACEEVVAKMRKAADLESMAEYKGLNQ